MDWIGAALTVLTTLQISFGCALQDIVAMVAMETGQEELGSSKSPINPSPSNLGLGWRMLNYIVQSPSLHRFSKHNLKLVTQHFKTYAEKVK